MTTLHEGCYRIWIDQMMLGSKEVVESASCWHSIAFPMWTEEYSSSLHFWSIPSFTDICMQRHFIQVLQGERWLIIQIAHESWVMTYGWAFLFFSYFSSFCVCELEIKDWKKSTSEVKESPNENNWVLQASTSQNGALNSKWLDLAQNRPFLVIRSLPMCSY
jgi:hypothetical protein